MPGQDLKTNRAEHEGGHHEGGEYGALAENTTDESRSAPSSASHRAMRTSFSKHQGQAAQQPQTKHGFLIHAGTSDITKRVSSPCPSIRRPAGERCRAPWS